MVIKEKEYIDVRELSTWLSLKPSTAYRMAENGELPSYKLGKLRRFNLLEIEAWLKNRRDGK